MKKYKLNKGKLIQEEIIELSAEDADNKIGRLERDIQRCKETIARANNDLIEYEVELKELKKLAGELNV